MDIYSSEQPEVVAGTEPSGVLGHSCTVESPTNEIARLRRELAKATEELHLLHTMSLGKPPPSPQRTRAILRRYNARAQLAAANDNDNRGDYLRELAINQLAPCLFLDFNKLMAEVERRCCAVRP
jgi:hypothetical protein